MLHVFPFTSCFSGVLDGGCALAGRRIGGVCGLQLHTIRALGIKLAAEVWSEAPGENVTFSRRRKEGDLEEEERFITNYLGSLILFIIPIATSSSQSLRNQNCLASRHKALED